MRRWNDRMLKTKMFISFSVVSLFIVGITCSIFYYKNTSDIQHQTFSLSNIISKQFSEMIDLYMQSVEELSLAISIDPSIQNILFDFYKASDPIEKEVVGYKLNPILFNFSYPKTYVQSMSIYSLDKHLYQYSKLVEPKPRELLSEEQLKDFSGSLNRKPFALLPSVEVHTDKEGSPERVVSFIRKITKIPTQTIIGFVSIQINVNAFNMVLANATANELESTMHVLIVADEGRIIYENGSTLNGEGQGRFDTGVFERPGSEGELRWKDTDYLYTFVRSRLYRVVYGHFTPEACAAAEAKTDSGYRAGGRHFDDAFHCGRLLLFISSNHPAAEPSDAQHVACGAGRLQPQGRIYGTQRNRQAEPDV
ncbi:cache domain-containing protein [Paenibacillus sp. TAB 01]|uniref:cache domain-containing protein n=1 Tax=Paenibacillus sp. TAB 01 TaxID=3368988 RepID=UPI003750B7DF